MSRGADFKVSGDFVFEFLKFVVCIDDVNHETSGAKESKYLFETINDVGWPSLVRDTARVGTLDGAADAAKRLNGLKFHSFRFHEQIWGTLAVHEVDVKFV